MWEFLGFSQFTYLSIKQLFVLGTGDKKQDKIFAFMPCGKNIEHMITKLTDYLS